MVLPTFTCCPRCHSPLREEETGAAFTCTSALCEFAINPFPVVKGQPVLVDFSASIFLREYFEQHDALRSRRDDLRTSLASRVKSFFATGENDVASRGMLFKSLAHQLSERPRILIIGGGALGAGTHVLYSDQSIEVIGTDVYASPITQIIADGHKLPFTDSAFDGVWIQAVLEHVLTPQEVVDEIHRVLKPDGVVYAETPFMQQVHGGAYDFTRFTLSGHRWLFRRFELTGAGIVGGPGTAMIWSIRYLVRALTGNNKIATGTSLLFFWLKYLDLLGRPRQSADGACGVYFMGRRAETVISPHAMLEFYDWQHPHVR